MKVYTHERDDGDIVLIPAKELYRYWVYHPVKTLRAFLQGIKRGYRREFNGRDIE